MIIFLIRLGLINHDCFLFVSLQLKLEESLQNMEQLTIKMTQDKEREKEQTKLVK